MVFEGRLLSCLNCPFADNIDVSNLDSIIQLVVWLEDTKIREYAIADRDKLRVVGEKWDQHFVEYLEVLECPFEWDVQDPCDVMSWLVNHAVAVEYEACVDDIDCTDEDQFVEDSAAVASNNPSSCSADDMNVVDNDAANIHEVQVSSEVDTLASLLDINRMKDEDDTRVLQRCYRIMRNKFPPAGANNTPSSKSIESPIETLTALNLGFDTKDDDVNHTAMVLKMLYLSDCKELQQDLNALIELGQEYTANPRTNTALGKVGR